jgi:hypothetical protein
MKSFAAIRSLSRIGRHAAALVSVAVTICAARTEAAVISIVPGDATATVTVDGTLTPDDGNQFRAKTSALTKAKVVLHSDGGSVIAGIAIGEAIRSKGFHSVVVERCASACALAWLGGTPRSMTSGAQIGFHAASDSRTGEEWGAANALVGAYLNKIGLPYAAVFYITKAAPTSMSWLNFSEAKQKGINVTWVDKSTILEESNEKRGVTYDDHPEVISETEAQKRGVQFTDTWDPRAKPYEPLETGMLVAILATIFWCGVFTTAYYFLVPFLERQKFKFFGKESVPQSKKIRIIKGVLVYFAVSVGVNLANYQDWWIVVAVIAVAIGGSALYGKGRSEFFAVRGEALTSAESTLTWPTVAARADTIGEGADQGSGSGGTLATVSILPNDFQCENDTTQDAFQDEAQRSDWEVAAGYYPDLDGIYADLRKISPNLALAFRGTLLETKQFSNRKQLARQLEEDFLWTYFGRNPKILWFARALIAGDHKAAAKELNRAISVLGGADENLIIGSIRKKFDLVPASVQSADARQLAETLSRIGPGAPTAYAKADSLIKLLGGTVTVSRWMFGAEVPALGERRHFFSTYGLVVWVKDTIAPQVLCSLTEDDKRQENAWRQMFPKSFTEQSLDILRRAQAHGYTFDVEKDGTVGATKEGNGTTYLRTDSDIQRFGRWLEQTPRELFDAEEAHEREKNGAYVQEALVVGAPADAMTADDHGTESGKPSHESGNGDYVREGSALAASAVNQGNESGKPQRSWTRTLVTAGALVLFIPGALLALALASGRLADTRWTSTDPFAHARDAYYSGDYATALRLVHPLADQGNANAQNFLGDMYYRGRGVPQDYAEAVKWYRKAANQGLADAQNNLGVMYRLGRGVPRDDDEAVKWIRRAADQGLVVAQNNLGPTLGTPPRATTIRWVSNASYGWTLGYRSQQVSSRAQCEKQCLEDARCVATDFNPRGPSCHLYDRILDRIPMAGSEVGIKQ